MTADVKVCRQLSSRQLQHLENAHAPLLNLVSVPAVDQLRG